MTRQIIDALEGILKLSFVLIVIFLTMAGYSYGGGPGAIGGFFAGLFIGVISTGTVFTLISINSNLEEIRKSIKFQPAPTISSQEQIAIRADGTKIEAP